MQLLGVTRWIIASGVSYPNEKLSFGLDLTGTMLYFGSPSADIAADFMPEQHRDVTIRKQILWESLDATDGKGRDMEVQTIRELMSNDPEVGYNR